jgi:hypothetical protein
MLMAIALSLAILGGCDEKKSDNSTTTLLALLGTAPWTVITPANGSQSVSYNTDFEIRYNNGTLDSTIDIESIQLTYDEHLLTLNDGNSLITIDGDTVTINPDASSLPESGTRYHNMVISGFEDSSGDPINTYTIPNYSIWPEPK